MINYKEYLPTKLLTEGSINVVEIRTGSDSDFNRILEFISKLINYNVNYFLTIQSAHRTPQTMIESAKAFPNIKIPEGVKIDALQNQVKISVAIAGGSAHIAGMTASETSTPIVALPVNSSAGGIVDSTFSMINMPPGIPNGFVPNQDVAAKMVKKIYYLELEKNFTNIQLANNIEIDKNLLKEFGLTIGESPISINLQYLESDNKFKAITEIPIIIPVIGEQLNWRNLKKMEKIQEEGFYMGLTLNKDIRIENAIIYAAKIIGIFNPEVRQKVKIFSEKLTKEVLKKNKELFQQQINPIN